MVSQQLEPLGQWRVDARCLNGHRSIVFCSRRIDGRVLFTDIRSSRAHYLSLDRDNIFTDNAAAQSRSTSTAVAHHLGIKSLQFFPDNAHLLTVGGDDLMYLWNVDTGQRSLVNYGPLAMNNIRIITMACAQMRHDRTKSVVYVPCGKSIRIYDVLSGQRLATLTGHLTRVSTCIYNSTVVELYTCSDDILVWAAMKKQHEDYEMSIKERNQQHGMNKSLGQILNRDQWSDDEDES